jgi:cytosine/adenosine deaminase-related metal-dependent hydrolase
MAMTSLRTLLFPIVVAALPAVTAAAEARLLVVNARLVTMAPDRREPFVGYLLADEDGRIREIGAGDPPGDTTATYTFDASGKAVLPGFLSGHSHLMQSVERGLAADQELLGWISGRSGRAAGGYVEGDLYSFVLHGALDYLRHGITTAYNYTARGAAVTPERYNEQLFAQLASGQRFVFGLSLGQPDTEKELRARFTDFLAVAEPYLHEPNFLKLSLSKAGLLSRGGERTLEWEVELARGHGLDIQMHYLEPRIGREQEQAEFTLIRESGLLDVGVMYAHFIHTTDEIVRVSGQKGARMIWNPLSNGRLASGLADIPSYRAAGIEVGMGIDGQASADVSDPFENMRMGMYQLRMAQQSPDAMQPYDVLYLHTLGTARALGVEDKVGSLEVGKYADFVVIDTADFDVGTVFDLYATLVLSCSIANLDWVFVGGEAQAQRGELLRHHFPQLSRDIRGRLDALGARAAAQAPR